MRERTPILEYKLVALGLRPREERINVIYCGEALASQDDSVVMREEEYERIFGKNRNSASSFKKRYPILKITHIDQDGVHSIYRKYRPSQNEKMKGKAAVTFHSLLFLKDRDYNLLESNPMVQIEPSNALFYLLHHPNEIVQSSFILAVVAIGISIVSLVICLINF